MSIRDLKVRVYRRQRKPVASSTHPLVKMMTAEMARQRATLTDVAIRSGVNVKTIGHWKSGDRVPKLRDLEAVLNVLGYELKAVPQKEEG